MAEKIKFVGLLVVLGSLYGGYEFYDFMTIRQTQMQTEIKTNRSTLETEKGQLARLTSFAEGITEVKSRLKKTNSEFEEVLEFIPRTLDLSKLLARLNVLARNSGVEIESFRPIKDSGAGSAPSGDTKTFYESVPVEMRLRGGFAQTVMFFDQVSRLKRILNIENLKMLGSQGDDKRGPASPVTMVETSITLKTYRFSE